LNVDAVLLDTGPLGLLTNPRQTGDALLCREAIKAIRLAGIAVYIPEIADYEVRRELIRGAKTTGIVRLNEAAEQLHYLSITTAQMRKAAELWAQARNAGVATADRHALDGDVILAAQAILLLETGLDVIVATDNVSHLSRFTPAARWQDIRPLKK
jgi:hypothetical protein